MRQVRRVGDGIELSALTDKQHPCGVGSGDQLPRRGGYVRQHLVDGSRRRRSARQLGHSLSEVVISRRRHAYRLPVERPAICRTFVIRHGGQCPSTGRRNGRPSCSPRSRRFRQEPTGPPPRCRMRTSHSLSCSTVASWAAPNVWILGGYQSDFARNLTREGRDFADLTAEVVDATLDRGQGRRRATSSVVHVGNAFGELFAGQGHLGAMPATVSDGLWDTPASRHEAACASGSVAALAAMADLRSGALRHRAGRRRRAGEDGARRHRRAAPRRGGVDRPRGRRRDVHVAVHVRPSRRRVRPPLRPRRRPPARHRRSSTSPTPARNPNAQTRDWTVPDPITDDDDDQPGRSRAGCADSTAAR